jgi:hypothetical protein
MSGIFETHRLLKSNKTEVNQRVLNSINRLEYLRDNHHYVSPNYKGLNYLLILINIDDKNISCLIDRYPL